MSIETSSREYARREILALAKDQKEHSGTFFVKALKGKVSRATVYKYLRTLDEDGYMEASTEKSYHPKFKITEKGLVEAERLRLLYGHVKDLSGLSAETLRKELLRYKQINDFLNLKLNKITKITDTSDFVIRQLFNDPEFDKLIRKKIDEGFIIREDVYNQNGDIVDVRERKVKLDDLVETRAKNDLK